MFQHIARFSSIGLIRHYSVYLTTILEAFFIKMKTVKQRILYLKRVIVTPAV